MFISFSFSQEATKNRIYALNSFEGGLATQLSDLSTPSKYARIAENVRLNSELKAIVKRSPIYLYGTADTTEPITGMHRLYTSGLVKKLLVTHGDELEVATDLTGAFTSILALTTGDYRWNWLTWHDLAIGGDGYNQPIKTNGTDATYLGTCFAEDNGAGAGPNGTYTYKIAFYTASYTVIFNVASNSVTVVDNDIDLSQIPIGPDTYLGEDVVGRKVYRSENTGGGTYKLLSNGTIANNTATTLTDSDADGALGAAYPFGDETWTPPKGKLHIIHDNRLFIANNPTYPSRIYYSNDGSHDLFQTAVDYFDIRQNDGDEITGLFNLLGILTISKTNSWQKLYTDGTDPYTEWSISDPFSHIGCDAMYSGVSTPLGVIYFSKAKSGIYVFNGQNSILKSPAITPTISNIFSSNLSNVCAIYNNNIYYMAYTDSSVGGSSNNRVLIYDLITNAYSIDTMSINSFCSFDGSTDGGVLYAGASDNGKVYRFSAGTNEIYHSTHSDFLGTFDDARYIPVSQGGDSNSPIIELSWDVTIDTYGAGTINAATGDVNRPDGSGTYISQVLSTPGASTYDKIYWNEDLPGGCDVTVAVRSGATAAVCEVAGWSSEFSVSKGSDISGVTANSYTQYRLTLSSTDIDFTPTVVLYGGYDVKLTYTLVGTIADTTIPLHWQSGIDNFALPMYNKLLRKIVVLHSGTVGTLSITFTNEFSEEDYFDIDLSTNPQRYSEYFTNGAFSGNRFKIDIENSDLNPLTIKEVYVLFDLEPIF